MCISNSFAIICYFCLMKAIQCQLSCLIAVQSPWCSDIRNMTQPWVPKPRQNTSPWNEIRAGGVCTQGLAMGCTLVSSFTGNLPLETYTEATFPSRLSRWWKWGSYEPMPDKPIAHHLCALVSSWTCTCHMTLDVLSVAFCHFARIFQKHHLRDLPPITSEMSTLGPVMAAQHVVDSTQRAHDAIMSLWHRNKRHDVVLTS